MQELVGKGCPLASWHTQQQLVMEGFRICSSFEECLGQGVLWGAVTICLVAYSQCRGSLWGRPPLSCPAACDLKLPLYSRLLLLRLTPGYYLSTLRAVDISLPNAATLQSSSSCHGDPQT